MKSANAPLLEVTGLKTYFRTREGLARAVDGVSFTVAPGETYALVGESGCGKSVTALSVMGLIPAPAGFLAGGSIRFEGRELTVLPDAERRLLRGSRMAMIFQEPMTSLNPVFTIGEQVMEGVRLHRPGEDARARALELLRQVRMPDPERALGQYPHQLSGGMRQRVMIAIALACRPSLLIADEATTALDVTIQAQIIDLVDDLKRDYGMAVLLITHNLGLVRRTAARIGVMYAGQLAEEATVTTLFASPQHPYTVRLLESLPAEARRGAALAAIPGAVPDATRYPPGCRFADRCHRVMEGCADLLPRPWSVGRGHRAACHLHDPSFHGRALARAARPPAARAPRAVKSTGALVEVENLAVHFPIRTGLLRRVTGHVRAVDGVSLAIPRGGVTAVVGESGCGKTTLGKALIGLAPPTAGTIRYDGQAVGAAHAAGWRRKMQIIFQDPYASLNPRLTVGEIVGEGLRYAAAAPGRAQREARVAATLELVGLDAAAARRYPHEFSGGQRQRVGIARALAVEPEFVVCDEATSALDVSVQAQILNLLRGLKDRLGLTYLFITHDLGVVEYFADAVAVMYLGRIVEHGTVRDVFESPRHPYTRALLAAVPRVDGRGRKVLAVGGDTPSPVNPPAGCHFHPRCPKVMTECRTAYPGETAVSRTHGCRCFLEGPGR